MTESTMQSTSGHWYWTITAKSPKSDGLNLVPTKGAVYSSSCQRFFQMKELKTRPSQKNNKAGKNLRWTKTETHSCDWQATGHRSVTQRWSHPLCDSNNPPHPPKDCAARIWVVSSNNCRVLFATGAPVSVEITSSPNQSRIFIWPSQTAHAFDFSGKLRGNSEEWEQEIKILGELARFSKEDYRYNSWLAIITVLCFYLPRFN